MLRERLSALELDRLDEVSAWVADGAPLPRRIAAYTPAPARHAPHAQHDALLAKVRLKVPEVGRLLADGLFGVRCRPDLASALADRDALGAGEAFVTPAGHLVSAQGVTFFAPDNELHGVLARQRELEALERSIADVRVVAAEARAQRDAVDAQLQATQQTYHAEGLAVGSQQRRVHDLELELVQLKQAAEAAQLRRAQLTQERADVDAARQKAQAEHEAILAEIADLQSRTHDEMTRREALRHARNEAEVAQARGRERVRVAERGAQEAGFAERSSRERLAELDRRTRGADGAEPAAARAARAADERAGGHRLDAGRGSAAAPARGARRGRAGAGGGARPAGSARGRPAQRRTKRVSSPSRSSSRRARRFSTCS